MFWNKISKQPELTEKLALSLQKASLNVKFQAASDHPDDVESVIASLNSTYKNAVILVQLTFASVASESSLGDFDYLQFYAPLPITVSPDYFEQTAILCEQLNARIPLIGFNLSRFENVTLAFRHMMLMERDYFNPKLVVRTLKLMNFLIDEYAPMINEIATGQKAPLEVEI